MKVTVCIPHTSWPRIHHDVYNYYCTLSSKDTSSEQHHTRCWMLDASFDNGRSCLFYAWQVNCCSCPFCYLLKMPISTDSTASQSLCGTQNPGFTYISTWIHHLCCIVVLDKKPFLPSILNKKN